MMEQADAHGCSPSFTLHPEPGPAPRLDFSDVLRRTGVPPHRRLADSACASPTRTELFPTGPRPSPSSSLADLSDLRPLGQIHDSFIIAAGRDGLWIIDQHVAHERILFEKVLKQRAAGRVEQQRLLMPLILQLTPGPADRICPHRRRTERHRIRDRAFRQSHDCGEGRTRRHRPRGSGARDLRDSGDRRTGAAQSLHRRFAPRNRRFAGLPRSDQDQHAPRSE